jgi:hypothetical protein
VSGIENSIFDVALNWVIILSSKDLQRFCGESKIEFSIPDTDGGAGRGSARLGAARKQARLGMDHDGMNIAVLFKHQGMS